MGAVRSWRVLRERQGGVSKDYTVARRARLSWTARVIDPLATGEYGDSDRIASGSTGDTTGDPTFGTALN